MTRITIFPELFDGFELGARKQGDVDFLIGRARQGTDLADGNLIVLAFTASTTSMGVRLKERSLLGLSQMRMAYSEPNTSASPTPCTRESGS